MPACLGRNVYFQAEPRALLLLFLPSLPTDQAQPWAASAESEGWARREELPLPGTGIGISSGLCGAVQGHAVHPGSSDRSVSLPFSMYKVDTTASCHCLACALQPAPPCSVAALGDLGGRGQAPRLQKDNLPPCCSWLQRAPCWRQHCLYPPQSMDLIDGHPGSR